MALRAKPDLPFFLPTASLARPQGHVAPLTLLHRERAGVTPRPAPPSPPTWQPKLRSLCPDSLHLPVAGTEPTATLCGCVNSLS